MVFFFSEPPVTGPPRKNNNFSFKEYDFTKEVVSFLPRIKADLESNMINLKTENQSIEDSLYLRAFLAYLLINHVEIYQYDECSDSLFCKNIRNYSIKIDGLDVTLHIGGGLGYEFIDNRLPIGKIVYHTMEYENKDIQDEFGYYSMQAVEHSAENKPIRMSLGSKTEEYVIESHYKSTGVEHHAFKNGHPINSTNKGFKLVPDKTITRIPVHLMASDMFGQTIKFGESIRDLIAKNDLILNRIK